MESRLVRQHWYTVHGIYSSVLTTKDVGLRAGIDVSQLICPSDASRNWAGAWKSFLCKFGPMVFFLGQGH